MKSKKCIIVDDDEIDRLLIVSYVKKIDWIEIVGVFETAESALQCLKNESVDIVFLDIELPGESGIELRRKILEIPVCVFVSSHFESAAETFEIQTLDFIVKPFKFERFEQTIKRIEEYFSIKTKVELYEESLITDEIYIKSGHDKIKIKQSDILFLEALKNYTIIVTATKKYYVLKGFSEILKEKYFQNFIRIHRSYAVCKDKIEKVSAQELYLIDGKKLPIGRNFKNQI
jgi:two-component system, LytTR family, response regulator